MISKSEIAAVVEPGLQRAQALSAVSRVFAKASIEGPALDARLLTLAALGIDQIEFLRRPAEPVGEEDAARLAEFAARRLAGEPISRILGVREFWGLDFAISATTLVPRPETETLVEAVLSHCRNHGGRDRPWTILDLGTGSGCIAVALLTELSAARTLGIDRSLAALLTARGNAQRHGVSGRACWVAGDWGGAIAATFDIVVANPPYIATTEIAALATEVRDYDPAVALDGGRDGLQAYRAIITSLGRLARDDGRIFFEVGLGQSQVVAALLWDGGFPVSAPICDLSGIPRVISAARKAKTGPMRGLFELPVK
jgi:release factor glutamine methyltransferase